MTENPLPKLITFDGGARSGKGTIAHFIKRRLMDRGIKVQLIDAGQVFRVLVVAATEQNVNFDDPSALDGFLNDAANMESARQLIKRIYRMPHNERDALLYTIEVSENSAKIGGRPMAQDFALRLVEKWIADAGAEGAEIVLLDGRALEPKAVKFEQDGLCRYVLGLYFVCDPLVGAKRTLGFANAPYAELTGEIRMKVDKLATQIATRNQVDSQRSVHPVVPPANAPHFSLPETPLDIDGTSRPMCIFDTSANLTKEAMSRPVADLVDRVLQRP